jgi:hypothetical protein
VLYVRLKNLPPTHKPIVASKHQKAIPTDMQYINLTTLGLSFDIIGVLLLWRYGLPKEDIKRDGSMGYKQPRTNEKDVSKAKTYDCFSHFGLGLIIAGFALQIAGAYLTSSDDVTQPEQLNKSGSHKTQAIEPIQQQ